MRRYSSLIARFVIGRSLLLGFVGLSHRRAVCVGILVEAEVFDLVVQEIIKLVISRLFINLRLIYCCLLLRGLLVHLVLSPRIILVTFLLGSAAGVLHLSLAFALIDFLNTLSHIILPHLTLSKDVVLNFVTEFLWQSLY